MDFIMGVSFSVKKAQLYELKSNSSYYIENNPVQSHSEGYSQTLSLSVSLLAFFDSKLKIGVA
jgi:hypothetical protein